VCARTHKHTQQRRRPHFCRLMLGDMTLTCDDLDVELPQLSFVELRNCGTELHMEAIMAQLRSKCPKLSGTSIERVGTTICRVDERSVPS
jgi:hypothetical protein